jgi:cell division protein FtsL
MLRLRTKRIPNPARDLANLNLRIRKSSKHRGVLKFRNRTPRPPGPYRPARLPRLTKSHGLGGYSILLFIMILGFVLAFTWKAQQTAYVLAHLDAARNRQSELQEKLKSLQLIMQEESNYSRIEPLARERLGMFSPAKPPIVIAPLDERVAAFPQPGKKEDLVSRKDQVR